VSDFLSRIAARAVGDAAAALPRVPGVFEGLAAASPATLEVVEEIVAQVGPQASPVEPTPPVPVGLPAAPTSANASPTLPQDSTTRPQVDARPAPPPSEDARPAPAPVAGPDRPERERVDDRPAPARPRMSSEASALRTPMAAVPVTAAVPALVGAPEPAAPALTADAQKEPPAVRVHIGRLEVRASLEEPAQQPRRKEPQPDELSLADYLRGERETA
jgi:hypothetical protein